MPLTRNTLHLLGVLLLSPSRGLVPGLHGGPSAALGSLLSGSFFVLHSHLGLFPNYFLWCSFLTYVSVCVCVCVCVCVLQVHSTNSSHHQLILEVMERASHPGGLQPNHLWYVAIAMSHRFSSAQDRSFNLITLKPEGHFKLCGPQKTGYEFLLDEIRRKKLVTYGATRGVTVSMSAFLTCHQCYCAGSSLAWGLNLRALVCGIFWSSSPGVFSGYSSFLPSFIGWMVQPIE